MSDLPAKSSWLSPEVAKGLQDYWTVYEAHFAEVQEKTLAPLKDHPVFGPLLAAIPPEVRATQDRENRERTLRGILHGDWEPYEANLRVQGRQYAMSAIPFESWYQITRSFDDLLVPLLIDAFVQTPARLARALGAFRAMLDHSLVTLGTAYLTAREQLAKSSDLRREAVLENALDAVVTMNAEGVITTFNAAAERLFGLPRAQAIGRPLAELVPEERRPQFRDSLRAAVVAGMNPMAGERRETTALRANGELVTVELSLATAVVDQSMEFMCFIRDLTETKRSAAQLLAQQQLARASEERALQAERARAASLEDAVHQRDDFLVVAGHELRTPLAALLLNLQGLQRAAASGPAAPGPSVADRVERLMRIGWRQKKLVDELMDISRIVSGRLALEPEACDLDDLIRETVGRIGESDNRQGSAISIQSTAPVVGSWDRLRLDQVLSNLVDNALKYGQGKPVAVELSAADGEAVVRVIDHGIGIDPVNQKRIFERFERAVASREFAGFGLGLWIARRIIEASGGTLDVQSSPGQGSTFSVRLPIRPAKAA